MKKRLLSIFLIVCLCAALLPTFAAAESEPGSETNPWILTQKVFDEANGTSSPVSHKNSVYYLDTGSYRLGEDITLSNYIVILSGENVTLDLDGHTLSRSEGNTVIEMQEYGGNGGTFVLNDNSEAKTGTISGGRVGLSPYCTFMMNGGTISGAETGVHLSSGGTFIMTGGSITDCETSICNWNGTVTLPRGTTLGGKVLTYGNFSFEGNTFENEVQHGSATCPINGGTFLQVVENGAEMNANHMPGRITGGVFREKVINYANDSGKTPYYSEIAGGVFYGEVENTWYNKYECNVKAKISGGVFLGGITGGGEITGEQHNITLDLGNGTTLNGFVVGDTLYPLGEPPVTREGYKFVGWFDEDGNPWDFEKQPTWENDFKLTAKWEEIPTEDEQPDGAAGLVAILDDIPFVDVDFNDYFYDAVKWAYHAGVTGGTDAWHFSPDAGCTRAQAVTFLWRAAGSPSASYLGNFSDVDADAYYAPAVAWAVANGVTNGTSATTFSPEAACSRGDIVTFLFRAFGGTSNGYHPFADVPASAYYADAVAWAYEHGVTGGTGAEKFSPADACSRAQIVTFLYRVLG